MLRELLSDGKNSSEHLRFPSHEELELMPPNIRESFMDLVFESLRRTLYPRFMFMVEHRRHLIEEGSLRASVPQLTSSFLSGLVCFHKWANLEQVAKSFAFRYVRPNTIVQLQGVIPSELLILASGQLVFRRREGPATCKGFPDSTTTITRTLSSVKCVDEKTFFTEVPSVETIKSSSNIDSKCLIWVLSKKKYFEFFSEQASDKQQGVRAACYASRKEQIPIDFPVTTSILQRMKIFSSVPVPMLQGLIAKLEPKTFWENETLCRKGHCESTAFLVARGTVEVLSDDASPSALVTEAWSLWGEVSLLFSKRMTVSVRALTNCDVYVLNREALTAIQSTAVMADVLTAAHTIAEGQQEQAKQRFFPMILKLPLFSKSTPEGFFRRLLQELSSVVYPINSTITSSSEACDRLIIPVRGRARVSSRNQDLRIGEAIGFTCLRPHRWKYHIFAVEAVQTLELRASRYREILATEKLLKFSEDCVDGLLFPNVFPSFFSVAISLMHDLQNPPMFEPSLATVVTPLEPRGSEMLPKLSEHSSCNKFRYMITASAEVFAPDAPELSLEQKKKLMDEFDCPETKTKQGRVQQRQRSSNPVASSPAMRKLFVTLNKPSVIATPTVLKPQIRTCSNFQVSPQSLSCESATYSQTSVQTDASFLDKVNRKISEMLS